MFSIVLLRMKLICTVRFIQDPWTGMEVEGKDWLRGDDCSYRQDLNSQRRVLSVFLNFNFLYSDVILCFVSRRCDKKKNYRLSTVIVLFLCPCTNKFL